MSGKYEPLNESHRQAESQRQPTQAPEFQTALEKAEAREMEKIQIARQYAESGKKSYQEALHDENAKDNLDRSYELGREQASEKQSAMEAKQGPTADAEREARTEKYTADINARQQTQQDRQATQDREWSQEQ